MDDITLSNQPPADELTRLALAAREALTDQHGRALCSDRRQCA